MNNDTIEAKQLFLREEIIQKGYDPEEFMNFLADQRGEEKIDLEYWTMEELKSTVESFKAAKLKQLKEKELEKLQKIRNTSVHIEKKSNIHEEEDNKENINNDMNNSNEEEKEDNNIIKCIKLDENEITNRDDLYIEIKLLEKDNKNLITYESEFILETKPIGFKTTKKISDFEYLFNKIPLINPEIFNPYLFIHKSQNKDEISKDTIIYLNYYMNVLIQSKYFRTLPLVYEFITKEEEEWENLKIEKYDKIKKPNERQDIPNLDGFFTLSMDAGDDEKCIQIYDELNQKNESFTKLNNTIDDLLKSFGTIHQILKNMSKAFEELKNRYNSSPNNTNLFAHLEIITKVWAEGYNKQKKFLNDEFRNFFIYMNKENNSFIKYYNNFKISYDIFKHKFEKISTVLYPSAKDKKILKHTQREFSFKLVNVYGEYKKINDNQAKRIEDKLTKVCNDKKIIFKEIEDIYSLLNFFNIKQQTKKEENERNNEKEKHNQKEIEKNQKENNINNIEQNEKINEEQKEEKNNDKK